ncbi:MAG TPA: CopD family protein [Longimicrobiales bacterium]|nr:CopD family protein [Longimicrobiales bacterium]
MLDLGRGLLYLSLTGLIGGASIRLVLMREGEPGVGLIRFLFALAGVGLFALLFLGVGQFLAFRDPYAPVVEDLGLLLSTPWGRNWLLAAGGFVVLLVALRWRGAGALALGLPFALAAYLPVSGHAAAVERWTLAAQAADWIHVVAAGCWLGALAGLLYMGRTASSPPLLRVLGRFSVQARWSVTALVATGAFASWLHLPEPQALLGSDWGRLLLVKLALVMLMMGLGAWNWRTLTPRLDEPEGASALIRASWGEAGIGILVLAVTAVLTGTSPP